MQIKKKAQALFCTALALCSLSAYAAKAKTPTTPKMPVWVTEPVKDYPSEQYIVGVGEGTTQQEAELDAIKKVASFFGQNVDSTARASKRILQAQDSVGKTITIKGTSISNDVQTKVSIENLVGVELRESYNDGKTFYVLAVMDKQKAQATLISSIEGNNRQIETLLKYAGDDEFSFVRYAQVDLAREIGTINGKLIERLRTLDPTKADVLSKNSKSKTELSKLRTQLAKQIPIYIEVENDFEDQIRGAIAQMVKENGFNTSEDSSERYAINISISLVKREPKDGKSVQVIYTVEGYLSDTVLGENLVPISIQGREGSVDMTDAIIRTNRAISSKIKTTVKDTFVAYLNSL